MSTTVSLNDCHQDIHNKVNSKVNTHVGLIKKIFSGIVFPIFSIIFPLFSPIISLPRIPRLEQPNLLIRRLGGAGTSNRLNQ